ncbi:MAG: antibiotic biosynthesis monooxygenase [Acidimicrobiia bacterium]
MPDPFVYLWDYRVSLERLDEFRELYGPNGSWVELFRRAPGYQDTQLLRDRNEAGRFVTIDRWESEEAFVSFRARFAVEFDHLDRLGEQLTIEETALGEFSPDHHG